MDYETLLSVIVGAAIGFLTSIGYEAWRQRGEKEDLKRRIREELKLIHSDLTHCIEKGESQCKTSTEVFKVLREDLVRKLEAETFRAIQDAYSRINKLTVAAIESYFKEALIAIEYALKLLDP